MWAVADLTGVWQARAGRHEAKIQYTQVGRGRCSAVRAIAVEEKGQVQASHRQGRKCLEWEEKGKACAMVGRYSGVFPGR